MHDLIFLHSGRGLISPDCFMVLSKEEQQSSSLYRCFSTKPYVKWNENATSCPDTQPQSLEMKLARQELVPLSYVQWDITEIQKHEIAPKDTACQSSMKIIICTSPHSPTVRLYSRLSRHWNIAKLTSLFYFNFLSFIHKYAVFISFSLLQLFPCRPTISKIKGPSSFATIITHTCTQPIEFIYCCSYVHVFETNHLRLESLSESLSLQKVILLAPQKLMTSLLLHLQEGVLLKFPLSELACHLVLLLSRSCLGNPHFMDSAPLSYLGDAVL